MNARWIALGGLWLVYAAFGATASSLAPLLPEIRAALGTDNTTLGAILGAWPLVYIAMAIPAGALLDAIGVRLGLALAAVSIAASAALRAWADTPVEMLLAVGVFGIGGPLISVGAPKTIAALFQGPSRGMAIGIYSTGPNAGAIATLMLTSGVLLPWAGSWQGVMLIHAGFALAAGAVWLGCAALAARHIPAPTRERVDMGALRGLLGQRDVLIVLGMAVGIFYINHAMMNWLPALLRAQGMAAEQAGYWAAVPTMVGIGTALVVPRLATPARRLPLLLALFAVALVASLLIAWNGTLSLPSGLILQGIVRGSMTSIAVLVLIELPGVPQNRVGLAGGLFFSAAEIGGVMGPFGFGLLRDVTGAFMVPLGSLTFVSAMLIALGLLLGRRGEPRPTE
ncbi:MAG: MFS transporter [Pseudooceanicola sp.]|nr:MFS transporter [Pseudooceanicola sp.]